MCEDIPLSNGDDPVPGKGLVARVALTPPSLQDNSADCDRLCRALQKTFDADRVAVDLSLRRRLPALLRENDYALRCLMLRDGAGAMLLHAAADQDQTTMAGLAVDLGTTRVVIRLVDLENRRSMGEVSFDNRQAVVGPDILARIHHADQPEGLRQLQQLVVDDINAHAEKLLPRPGPGVSKHPHLLRCGQYGHEPSLCRPSRALDDSRTIHTGRQYLWRDAS